MPCVKADAYTLTCAHDRPYVYLSDTKGKRLAELFALAGVHTLSGRDDTVSVSNWEVTRSPDEIILTLTAVSSIWQKKTVRFRCQPHRFSYEVEVEGQGSLTDVIYFGGYYSGQVRWGSGFFWSSHRFKKGFNPEPTTHESYHFNPDSGSIIDLSGVPLPGKGSWFFTPPPFCFAFAANKQWVGFGVEAAPGENRYDQYEYRGQQGAFSLSLAYEGYTQVDGHYALPAIGIDFGGNEYEALERHVDALRAKGCVADRSAEVKPDWWHEPIYCGWGSQCYVASLQKKTRAPDYARQVLYEDFLTSLESRGISPGIVVLDDKWQATYGENRVDESKWHDIRGFIADQHAAGRKVLLWLKAWDPEGIPTEECVTNAAGLALAVDPTNPAFEARFRESIRVMLSDYNADGFKIDFTARIPVSPGARSYENVWGLELMKRYLSIIYSEAKRVKPDALVMSHTPHPYLSDVLDMIRLNDINIAKDVRRSMTHRAKIAQLACRDAIIDTDNWPIKDKRTWRSYMQLQPELGVPSLYYATHIDSTQEPLDDDDYALIRDTWAAYRTRTAVKEKIG